MMETKKVKVGATCEFDIIVNGASIKKVQDGILFEAIDGGVVTYVAVPEDAMNDAFFVIAVGMLKYFADNKLLGEFREFVEEALVVK